MPTIHLAVGSNLGDRVFHLRSAVAGLAPFVRVERLSAVYESAPMYVTDQPPFLNMALAGTTELSSSPFSIRSGVVTFSAWNAPMMEI